MPVPAFGAAIECFDSPDTAMATYKAFHISYLIYKKSKLIFKYRGKWLFFHCQFKKLHTCCPEIRVKHHGLGKPGIRFFNIACVDMESGTVVLKDNVRVLLIENIYNNFTKLLGELIAARGVVCVKRGKYVLKQQKTHRWCNAA